MRVALIGFGRIGRAIFRINHARRRFDIVAINDINPDINNIAYLAKYDSTYGRFAEPVSVDGDDLVVNGTRSRVFHHADMRQLPWDDLGVDMVIDASGVHDNVLAAHDLVRGSIRKVVITHAPDEVDHTIVLGANEDTYDPAVHHVVSSSICDTVAVAPVLRKIDDTFGLDSGFLTTLHPWLAYQNLLDGPSVSWAQPGTIYSHYAIGRSSPGTLIPKPTSAIDATSRVLPQIAARMQCMSFRVPTQTVGAANLCLNLKSAATVADIATLFDAAERAQSWPLIHNNREPLVSVDFAGTEYSAVVDHRWTAVFGPRQVYLVIWYDNEWGYSSRVVDVAAFMAAQEGVSTATSAVRAVQGV